MKTKQVFALILSCLLTGWAFAQDIHFSQYDFSPLHQSAANTGNFKGDYRFTAIHRNQYRSVTVPYKTIGASFDMKLGMHDDARGFWSAGLLFEQDKTGDANFGTLNAEVSVAYHLFIDADKKQEIVLGIQPGFFQNGLDFGNLYFGNQYDSTFYNPAIANGESLDNSKHAAFNFNAGVVYRYAFTDESDAQLVIGLNHINQPGITFYNDTVSLFMRMTGELLFNFKLNDQISLQPQVLYYNQKKFRQWNAGSNITFRTNATEYKSYRFLAGVFIRPKDAVIARIGVGYNNLDIGFAYDFNTSDLKRASNGRGAYEIALKYIITKVKPLKKNPPCPVY